MVMMFSTLLTTATTKTTRHTETIKVHIQLLRVHQVTVKSQLILLPKPLCRSGDSRTRCRGGNFLPMHKPHKPHDKPYAF